MNKEIGKKYNSYTVLRLDQKRTGKYGKYYLCLCDCGKEKIVQIGHLRTGHTKSCGCYKQKINRIEPGESSWRSFFDSYRQNCKRSGRSFSLTMDEFKDLTSKNCEYCGVEPKLKNPYIRSNGTTKRGLKMTKEGTDRAWIKANGIDRIDNSKDYTLDNCTACCVECNFAKHGLTQSEFLIWLDRVVSFRSASK